MQISRAVGLFFLAMAAVTALNAVPSTSRADLLYHEPFAIGSNPAAGEYTLGNINGQNPTVPGFTDAWAVNTEGTGAANVVGTNLCYLSICGTGGSVVLTPNSQPRRSLADPLESADTGTYYMSFLVNYGKGDFSAGIDSNNMGYRALEFLGEGGTFLWGLAYNAYGGFPGQLGSPEFNQIHLDGFGAKPFLPNAPPSFIDDDGSTHLFVLKIELSSAAAADSLLVYLNPTSPLEPILESAAATNVDITLSGIRSALFGGGGAGTVTFDEFQFGTLFSDVMPPVPYPGDTDGDDDVDFVDFATILNNMRRTGVTGGPSEGDVAFSNGKQGSDGRVDLGDMWIWKRNEALFGSGSGNSGSMPEPSSMLLILLAGTFLATCRAPVRLRNELRVRGQL